MATSRVRIEEVARLAGVSAITVSRALNKPEKVNAATRERVLAAVAQTGYVPNTLAGNLASKRTRMVAAFVPTITNSIFADTVHGLSEVLDPAGYQLMLGRTGYALDRELELVSTALSQQCCGIVVTGRRHKSQTRTLLARSGVPVVEIWNVDGKPLDKGVGFSNHDAAYAMVAHLAQAGYRRIAFACAPLKDNDRAMRRLEGYRKALADFDLYQDSRYETQGEFGFDNGATALDRLRRVQPMPDAIFFANDILAIGALLACQRLGVRVPEDLGIAGFDDVELASHVQPGLTTVRVPRYEIGKTAGQVILDSLNGTEATTTVHDLGFGICQRGSTRAPIAEVATS